jgi:hypothetical protein
MTVLTWFEDVSVVKYCACPCIFRMTVVAGVGAGKVLRMFTRGSAAVMTEVTDQRRALELATDMTTRTIQEFMSAEQWEPGREVVKTFDSFFGLKGEVYGR